MNKINYLKSTVYAFLDEYKLDALVFYSPTNRLWFTGFMSSEGYLLITKKKVILYLDGRYITAGRTYACNVDEFKNYPQSGSVLTMIKEDLVALKCNSLGFETSFITHQQYLKMQGCAQIVKGVDFTKIRAIKSPDEIKKIKEACDITKEAILAVQKNIKPGMTEKEVASIVNQTFLKAGADKESFDTIVASGVRGAMPHGLASSKIIKAGEMVTLDLGCEYQGYCSDITRSFTVGKCSEPKLLTIFKVVAQAQSMGIKAVKPGITTKAIDQICRSFITEQGFGKYFSHSTGHGLGIDVHEYPYVSPLSNVVLKPGMIITVEPGIYIPELGGVRIEDDILVTETGYEILSNVKRYNDNYIPIETNNN